MQGCFVRTFCGSGLGHLLNLGFVSPPWIPDLCKNEKNAASMIRLVILGN